MVKHLPCHSPASAVTLLASFAVTPCRKHRLHSHAQAVDSKTDDVVATNRLGDDGMLTLPCDWHCLIAFRLVAASQPLQTVPRCTVTLRYARVPLGYTSANP